MKVNCESVKYETNILNENRLANAHNQNYSLLKKLTNNNYIVHRKF